MFFLNKPDFQGISMVSVTGLYRKYGPNVTLIHDISLEKCCQPLQNDMWSQYMHFIIFSAEAQYKLNQSNPIVLILCVD